jgi:hypothetical protein
MIMSIKKTSNARKNIMSGADVLKNIGNSNKKIVTKPSKSVKWEIVLDDSDLLIAEHFVEAKSVFEKFESNLSSAKNELHPIMQDFLIEEMWNTKSRPRNPLVLLKRKDGSIEHSFQYILCDSFNIKCPDEVQDRLEYFMDLLAQCGLSDKNSKIFLENEVCFEPVHGFKTLNALLEGTFGKNRAWIESTQEEKVAGLKLSSLMVWRGGHPIPEPLTEKENVLILEMSKSVQVKAGFLQRVAGYCKTKEQLRLVLTIFKPTMYASHLDFCVGESEDQINKRQNKIAKRIINSDD